MSRDLRARINLWLSDTQYDWILNRPHTKRADRVMAAQEWLIEKPAKWLLCRVAGHKPVGDQCGMPEHDFCIWCDRSMPGAALRGDQP